MAFGDLTFVEMTSITSNAKESKHCTIGYCFCCVAPHLACADNTGRSQYIIEALDTIQYTCRQY